MVFKGAAVIMNTIQALPFVRLYFCLSVQA